MEIISEMVEVMGEIMSEGIRIDWLDRLRRSMGIGSAKSCETNQCTEGVDEGGGETYNKEETKEGLRGVGKEENGSCLGP